MSRLFEKPELLAPVGSPDALLAAVRCGADAVYLGAGRFHARQHASPLDEDALKATLDYCREHGVAVHITLNTLVREDEFDAALADAEKFIRLGADALIVQDRGLADAIRKACPSMPLHASTQLTCHTPAGVQKLQDDGFSRVVLAREMTGEEIAACAAVGCEIEAFVHGALCMSVSGQCFLSSLLGGRSGNRGECAQPCRLPFAVGAPPTEADRALSLKDLSLSDRVRELAAVGVSSLKIEGRMKRPEYVAAAVAVCRAALDGKPVDPTLAEDLRAVFSRSGFTDGYFIGKRTAAMFGSRTKEDVTAAPAAQKRLSGLYHKETPRVPVSVALRMPSDTATTLTVTDGTHTVTAVGETARQSERPLSDERLSEALKKCGGTPFYVTDTTVTRADGTDHPLSAVNALRREALTQLTARRRERPEKPFAAVAPPSYPPYETASTAVVVRLQDASQFSASLVQDAALVTVPLSTPTAVLSTIAEQMPTAVEVPRGLFGSEERLRRQLAEAKAHGAKAAMVHNVGALPLCREAALPVIGGFGLHAINRRTLCVCAADGLAAQVLSFEPFARQTSLFADAPLPVGQLVYGHLPLMLLRNCPAKAAKGCADCRQDRVLVDRKGVRFPLVCENGCADLLNSVPLYLADRPQDYAQAAFVVLHMTTESAARVAALTALHRRAVNGESLPAKEVCPDGFTRAKRV